MNETFFSTDPILALLLRLWALGRGTQNIKWVSPGPGLSVHYDAAQPAANYLTCF